MQYCYPSEHERHHATWLSFCANHAVWQDLRITAAIQANISRLALNIARFEPVKILVRPEEMVQAKNLMGSDVEYIEAALDDIWLRDSGAVFVKNSQSGEKTAMNFNFNGWGNKQEHERNTHAILQEQFIDREIIQLNIDGIAAGGGGIHCATQQQPR